MEKESPKLGKKGIALRVFIYLSILLVFVVAVLIQKKRITQSRSADIVNFYDEWKEYGKPISILKALNTEFAMCDRITAVAVSENVLESFVSKSMQKGLKAGQHLCVSPHYGNTGKVESVSDSPDINSGLYKVRIVFRKATKTPGSTYHVRVATHMVRNVIKVPVEAVMEDDSGAFVWLYDDEKVRKSYVKRGLSDGINVVIDKGIDKDDMVVIDGMSDISRKDKVRVFECSNCRANNG